MGPPALPQKCEINDFLSICLLSAHSVADSSKAILFFAVRVTFGGITSKRSSMFAASPRGKPCRKPWLAANTHCITLVR